MQVLVTPLSVNGHFNCPWCVLALIGRQRRTQRTVGSLSLCLNLAERKDNRSEMAKSLQMPATLSRIGIHNNSSTTACAHSFLDQRDAVMCFAKASLPPSLDRAPRQGQTFLVSNVCLFFSQFVSH